jgi:hypothetical protein
MDKKIRGILCDMGYENAIVFDNPDYDEAIIGITDEGNVVYDFNKMVKCLVDKDGMDDTDAIEFIEYNTIRALPYIDTPPIIMNPVCME